MSIILLLRATAVSFFIIIVPILAQPGFSKKEIDPSFVMSFGADIKVEKDSRDLIFSGDFNGDTIDDLVAVVSYSPYIPLSKDVRVLLPWGKPQLDQSERPRALAIIIRKPEGIHDRFLVTGDALQSWEESWENRGVGIVRKHEVKSATGNAILPS